MTNLPAIIETGPSPEPADVNEKIKDMRDILQNFEDDVLKLALRYVNWDMTRAINDLLDEENINRYRKEVEQKKQSSNL